MGHESGTKQKLKEEPLAYLERQDFVHYRLGKRSRIQIFRKDKSRLAY